MDYKYFDQVIKKRQSSRDFSEETIDIPTLGEVRIVYDKCPRLCEDIDTELSFVETAKAAQLDGAVGYNGFLIKAPKYLAIFSEEKENYLENAGFIGQALTLKLTELGLDACWLTVNDAKKAQEVLGEHTGMVLAAFIAFGHKNKEKTVSRVDIKSMSNVNYVKSGNKLAPKISLDDLLYDGVWGVRLNNDTLYDELKECLLAVSDAQSFYNRQPYRVIVDDAAVYLIGIPDEMTGETDKHLNYGIAMFNFYALLDQTRADAPMWSFEAPKKDLKLPEDCVFVAKCRI